MRNASELKGVVKEERHYLSDCTITTLDNGPYLIKGAFRVMDGQEHELVATGETVALCRCGASDNKPFCDGTHVQVSFHSTVRTALVLAV